LFIMSPGITLLDTWLPVFKNLDKKNYEINLFLNKPSILYTLDRKNLLLNISKEVFHKVYLNISKNKVIQIENLNIFLEKFSPSKITNILKKLFSKIHKQENIFINNFLDISELYIKIISFSLFSSQNYKILNTHDAINSHKLVCYDVTEERKKKFSNISKLIKNIKKISAFHGTDIKFLENKKTQSYNKIHNIVQCLYSFNQKEKDFYEYMFGVDNFLVAGCPKLDSKWLNYINENYKIKNYNLNNSKNVLLISRLPASYLPQNHKIQFLNIIKKKLMIENNYNLMIKRHPREHPNSINNYFKIFEKKKFNKDWTFVDDYPALIGTKCDFAICFFSGVSIELLNINKPTIELLNLDEIPPNKIKDEVLIDENNHKVKINRFLKLVYGANDEESFSNIVDYINANKTKSVENLKKNYTEIYKSTNIIDDYISLIENQFSI